MSQRVPTRLWPHRETVRLASDGNSMGKFSGRRVEHVDLVVVAPRYPKLLSIRGDVTHVGASTAGNRPGCHDAVGSRIEHADRAGSVTAARDRIPAAVGHVEVLAVPARINSVSAHSQLSESEFLPLLRTH